MGIYLLPSELPLDSVVYAPKVKLDNKRTISTSAIKVDEVTVKDLQFNVYQYDYKGETRLFFSSRQIIKSESGFVLADIDSAGKQYPY